VQTAKPVRRNFGLTEDIKGYAFLGGLAGILTPVCHTMLWGLFCVFILGLLFKGCIWLFQRDTAINSDICAIKSGLPPSALIKWNEDRINRRNGLNKEAITCWFCGLAAIMVLFAILPAELSGRIFSWILIAELCCIICTLIRFQFLWSAFSQALGVAGTIGITPK
jgi:hypothetical protein